MITKLKKILRPLYYVFANNRIVQIERPYVLKGLKWIEDNRFGRAYHRGYYEPKIVNFLLTTGKDGDVFLDIGGHAGYFSYIFSRLSPSGKVYTFEPDRKNADFIKQIIALNQINNIELIPKGAGNKTETLLFELGATSSTGKVSEHGSVEVPVVAVDDLFGKPCGIRLMKIDVEGFGGKVIQGAWKTIESNKPVLLMELHDNSDERTVLGDLSRLGYNFYNLDLMPEKVSNVRCRFFIAKPEIV